jgi:hypothetical protein
MRPVLVSLLALFIIGCSSSASFSINDRTITARASPFRNISISNPGTSYDGTGATVYFGDTAISVTASQITWKNGTLKLPANWNQLELVESGNAIAVTIDGMAVSTIHPAG